MRMGRRTQNRNGRIRGMEERRLEDRRRKCRKDGRKDTKREWSKEGKKEGRTSQFFMTVEEWRSTSFQAFQNKSRVLAASYQSVEGGGGEDSQSSQWGFGGATGHGQEALWVGQLGALQAGLVTPEPEQVQVQLLQVLLPLLDLRSITGPVKVLLGSDQQLWDQIYPTVKLSTFVLIEFFLYIYINNVKPATF